MVPGGLLVTGVRKAVIPAAGLGVRFLPITKAQPKEMLPVVNKPVIQYVIEEAYHAGLDQILLITGKHKRAIEDHLDRSNLSSEYPVLREFDAILDAISLFYTRQKVQAGLGDAIRYAEAFVDDEYFAVLLGDNITFPNCTRDLIAVHQRYNAPVIAIERISPDRVKNHGVIVGNEVEPGVYRIREMHEKPDEPLSDLAIIGRYILPPEIFGYLSTTERGYGGEVQLTDALHDMIRDGRDIYAVLHTGKRFDLGNNIDWLRANLEIGLEDAEVGRDIKNWITDYTGRSSE